jgi:hypothetical protein
MAGTKVFESEKREFDVNLSLLNAPTGKAVIEIVGVGIDGVAFAPETIEVDVRSPYYDALLARDVRAKQLGQMVRQMSEFDQEVVYWYERARQEPEFRTYMFGKTIFASDEFGRMASVGYVDSFTFPGNAGKYMAECKAAIVRRAQHRLEIGKLQKTLGMRENATSTLRQVIAEVGEGSGIGLAAVQELRGQ